MLKLLKTNYDGVIEKIDINIIKETEKQYRIKQDGIYRTLVNKGDLNRNLDNFNYFGVEVLFRKGF